MKEKLKVLRGSAVDTLIDACVNSLAGDGYLNISGGVGARKEEDSSMSFIQEARRRNKIDRLSRFIGLADYISIFLLMKLLENTYFEFLNVITSCTKLLPDEERLKSDEKLDGADGDDQVFDLDVRSYIEIDMILSNDTGDVAIDPALKIFHLIISKIQNHWEKCLREILESHPSSVRFDNSLGSVIPCGYSKSRVGDAERLSNIIKNSLPIQNYKEELTKELNLNTNAVDLFCKRFGVIETFYKSMRACTEEIIRGNESIEVFRNWCTEYREKEEEIEEIVDTQVLGIFMVHLDGLKTQALSLLFYNRGIIADVIPKIGKSKVDILLSKILDDTTYLDTDPTTADCFANYVEFINDAQRRIDSMEIDGDYVKDLYDITEEFAIPVDPEDFANYLMINVALTSLKIAVADRLKKRDDLIAKFNEQISNDVRKLTDDVSVINELISESWLLDPASEPAICLKTLKDLDSNLQECIKIVDKYQDYQKSFDLETIRLDILDLVRREIHLRILLWECILLWEESSRRWYEGDFRDLNPEEMTQTTDQLKDNVGELETGLGRRPIVLNLKENVGQVRDKLPTISCLRNKHLRRRHWLEVEAILNYKFKPDVRITLTLIEGLGAFAYSQELMNISGRATSEANQEAILNRIDDA
ncbi:dynein heavy chain 6, axonemal isoform X2 [Fopius arisanus]|nr:PREDICTED: dynein heavy chain 6, axonemal-like isoform X2 [Fopius arisanus]